MVWARPRQTNSLVTAVEIPPLLRTAGHGDQLEQLERVDQPDCVDSTKEIKVNTRRKIRKVISTL